NDLSSNEGDHLRMPRPLSPTKVLLVADRRADARDPKAATIRRYRLARMRLDGGRSSPPPRIARRLAV
ncbi:MAG: hypothetical protein M3018_12685, partial [Actinomycetota bacterium]|nr:hypothetical protein [Actinomycetota bacterium]